MSRSKNFNWEGIRKKKVLALIGRHGCHIGRKNTLRFGLGDWQRSFLLKLRAQPNLVQPSIQIYPVCDVYDIRKIRICVCLDFRSGQISTEYQSIQMARFGLGAKSCACAFSHADFVQWPSYVPIERHGNVLLRPPKHMGSAFHSKSDVLLASFDAQHSDSRLDRNDQHEAIYTTQNRNLCRVFRIPGGHEGYGVRIICSKPFLRLDSCDSHQYSILICVGTGDHSPDRLHDLLLPDCLQSPQNHIENELTSQI